MMPDEQNKQQSIGVPAEATQQPEAAEIAQPAGPTTATPLSVQPPQAPQPDAPAAPPTPAAFTPETPPAATPVQPSVSSDPAAQPASSSPAAIPDTGVTVPATATAVKSNKVLILAGIIVIVTLAAVAVALFVK